MEKKIILVLLKQVPSAPFSMHSPKLPAENHRGEQTLGSPGPLNPTDSLNPSVCSTDAHRSLSLFPLRPWSPRLKNALTFL